MDFGQYLNKILNFSEFSRKNKILLIAFFLRDYQGVFDFSARDITELCKGVIKPPSKIKDCLLDLSRGKNATILKSSKNNFFSLSLPGVEEVHRFLSDDIKSHEFIDKFRNDTMMYLNKIVMKISEENKQKFLKEAILCLKVNANRATIIMTWACIVDHLYDYILQHKLTEFNIALTKTNSKITINHKDDFSDIKEKNFIELLRTSNIITNDIRKILDEKLGIRNSAAHPSGIEIHDTKVVNFIEDLIDNVILKYEV
jgi:hypothetical protein